MIKITFSPIARACQARLTHRLYSQNTKIPFGKAVFKALANKLCPQSVSPEPSKTNGPHYIVLTKAECEAHDEELWNRELKKASEEFKKSTENKS